MDDEKTTQPVRDRSTELQIKQFEDAVRKRVAQLRNLADRLDREADRVPRVGTPEFRGAIFANNYTWTAAQVVHEVMGALPNLSLDQLVTNARELDELTGDGRR